MENNQVKKKVSTKNVIIAAAAAVGVVALILLIMLVLVPRNEYLLAEDLVAAGQHGKAVMAFRELGNYSDSQARADALMEENPGLHFTLAKPGDIVTYGVYEQDGDTSNGPEPIEWIVLVQEEEQVLAVSRDILDAKQYHLYEDKVLPQVSNLSRWLELDFASAAFEGNLRTPVKVAGLLKEDYLAVLDEMNVPANVSAYAQASGAGSNWWLYENQSYAENMTALTADGDETGFTEILGVRPAIWVLSNNDLLAENAEAVAEELRVRENAYEQGKKLMVMCNYESALQTFALLGTYADAQEKYLECRNNLEMLGVSSYELATAMAESIAEANKLAADVKDSAMQTKEMLYICSAFYPYCGNFTFEADGTTYTFESDFRYDSSDQCVYWVARQEEDGLFTTEEDGQVVGFFDVEPVVLGMVATSQLGAEEVEVSFEDGQIIATWGEYLTIETDEDGNVTSREDYQQKRIITGIKQG